MPEKWVRKWKVPKSQGNDFWTVSVDAAGLYGCSCPVWKFRRQECKHIAAVKDGCYNAENNADKGLAASPGNVGEVVVEGNIALYPLVPLGRAFTTDLIATIVYDLITAGVKPEYVKDYKDRMFDRRTSISTIVEHVKQRGRLVFSRLVEGQGWVDPVYVSCDESPE